MPEVFSSLFIQNCYIKCVILIIQIAENFVDLANSLPNVKVAFYGGFSVSPEFAVREIYPLDVRIIFGTFGESQARSALCQVRLNKKSIPVL